MSLWYQVEKAIMEHTKSPYKITSQLEVGGGCINSAYKISDGATDWFVKTNRAALIDMFVAEAESLDEIAASNTVKVPRVLCYGITGEHSYLVLEYLDLSGATDMESFATQLAAMHRNTSTEFGWHRSNVIGETTQKNTQKSNWIDFWREERLGYQLGLAQTKGCGRELVKQGERLSECLDEFFDDYTPQASMLHGDLWGGNCAALNDSTPVIFDPAFYYGDREADIAMTTLFGGFNTTFYQSYNKAWPLEAGYEQRKIIYNTYHIINHYNLFGGGYEEQAINMMRQVLD